MFFGGWLSPFPASWTFTHYFPSAILIPFGLWVIWDGIRYETLFGRIILPGAGTVITALGALFVLLLKDRKSTRLNSSHANISYAVFCLKKKKILMYDLHVTVTMRYRDD